MARLAGVLAVVACTAAVACGQAKNRVRQPVRARKPYEVKFSSAKDAVARLKALGAEYRENISREIAWVSFADTAVRDSDLAMLKYFPFLINLNLSRTKITDAGLKHVGKRDRLKELYLYGTSAVTDKGIAHLQDCDYLQKACFDKTKITDKSLKYMKGWEDLRILHIDSHGEITDKGLKHLEGLEDLRELKVSEDVSARRICEWKKAHPRCRVIAP